MSNGESKLADQQGKFTEVIQGGRKVPDLEWHACRLLLSSKRLILVSAEGKRTIPLAKLQGIKSRESEGRSRATVDSYLSVKIGKDVILLSPRDHQRFEQALFTALLDQQVVAIKHPAVKGGVIQNVSWSKGRLTLEFDEAERTEDGSVALASADGQFVSVDISEIGEVEERDGDVLGEPRTFIAVTHTEAGVAVQTNVAAPKQQLLLLASLLRKGELENTTDVELTPDQREVMMALYSGVSPFQIPDFTGMDVQRVEEIYEELIDIGILREKRNRREVKLKTRGRTIASEAIEQE